MSIVANQRRILGQLLAALRPHWRRDPALPDRIERLLRRDRRLGSSDRRLYRELIYTALRYLPWIEPRLDDGLGEDTIAWLAADTPDTSKFRAGLTAGWPPCPAGVATKAAHLGADPNAVLPPWLRSECPEAFAPERRDALCARSPLWIRLQTDETNAVLTEFDRRGWAWQRSPLLPDAVRLAANPSQVTATAAHRTGQFEIQDIGSQLILASAGIEPGGHWLDACAGAGGKTLQLAWLLGPGGRVDAHDIRAGALTELLVRAARRWPSTLPVAEASGLSSQSSETLARSAPPISIPKALRSSYDGILIDAPCSGSGTWRRQPHLKWTTRPDSLPVQADRQFALLAEYAPRVRPGGRLIYATCSLARTENESVLERFLASFPAFRSEPAGGVRYWPDRHDGDGFFAAYLRCVSG